MSNDITCDLSCAKITVAALNRDNTARLAHGESHVSTCNPPRAKKAIAVLSQISTARLAHDKSHVLPQKMK